MTRAELLDRMSSRELTEWMVYASIEPFGGEQAAIATQTALLANIHRDRKVRREPFTADDFLFSAPAPDDDEPDRDAVARKVAAMFGAPT